MASNPMQKKARNSFLLGVVITLIICLAIGAAVYFLVMQKDKEKEKQEEDSRGIEVKAYVLNQDVKSGQVITEDLFKEINLYSGMVPTNYIKSTDLYMLRLQDEDGNVMNTASTGELYIVKQGNTEYKTITNDKNDKDKVLIEIDGNKYYRTRKDNNEKEEVKFVEAPVVAKIDMKANTILTTGAIAKSDAIVTDDVRYIEYNMLSLPTTIAVGDFIDVRLTLPSGQDLIVISKKEVKSLLGDTLGLEITEGELLMMESAIVEAYVMKTSRLYAIQYVEPGNQEAAIKTYSPTVAVQNLIAADPNIKERAKDELQQRFIGGMRENIDGQKAPYVQQEEANLETGIKDRIEEAKKAREAYLSGLESY